MISRELRQTIEKALREDEVVKYMKAGLLRSVYFYMNRNEVVNTWQLTNYLMQVSGLTPAEILENLGVTVPKFCFRYIIIPHITVPANIKQLNDYAFAECPYLKVLELESKSMYFKKSVFDGTPIQIIKYNGTMTDWNNQVKLDKGWLDNCKNEIEVTCSDGVFYYQSGGQGNYFVS